MSVACVGRIEALLSGGSFLDGGFDATAFDYGAFFTDSASGATDLTPDVIGEIVCSYGIDGSGPADCMAGTGELHFDLNNSALNSGAVLGWYSPAFSGKRTGWTYGIPVRFIIEYNGTEYVRFLGKIAQITPDAGSYRSRRVHVVAYDCIRDLMEADARQVAVQTSKTEAQLISAILAVLPSTAQPVSTSLATGLDTYAYAFDNIGGGAKAAAILKDVTLSSLGVLYSSGPGALTYKTRRQRATAASALTLSNTPLSLVVPSGLDGVYNRVRATVHPKTVDAAATTVLWSQTGSQPSIAAGASGTFWGTYHDPSNTLKLIGGIAVVTPIIATTDYTANTAADGSGSDRTANMSVATTAFASTVKYVVTNTGSDTLYITKLQVRGKGVYDNGPRSLETYAAMAYGDRPIEIDMPYQDDVALGQSVASFLCSQYDALASRVQSVEFFANYSAAFMVGALTLEPSDVVTITESVSGLAASLATIQKISLRLSVTNQLRCTYTLAPSAPYVMWQIGVAGKSEIGSTTVLGF